MLMRLRGDHLAGRRGGLVSICSARREVLAAAFDLAAAERCAVVVEATANQVNPAGGYTGMSPEEFIAQAARLAQASGIGRESLLVGADHLGPAAWAREPARSAMARAAELARRCAAAGFGKLHLDTGFGCADDPPQGVPPQEAAARAALICRAAEDGAGALPPGSPRPLYVIGAEVPPPGGSLEAGAEAPVTSPAEIAEALRVTAEHFQAAGLAGAWERVAAIVVQPGVDFGDESVAVYRPERARELSSRHAALPGVMTYEVHSTDFQPPEALAALVRDHFTLLKVGPCLTFAFREAVFALAAIEGEWLGGRRGLKPSLIRPLLEQAMKRDPAHWERHYRGPRSRRRYLRGYSLRDRIRYYWARPEIAAALSRLMANLNAEPLPAGLIRQFFPESAEAVRRGEIPPRPEALVRRRIQMALRPYLEAGRAPGEGSRK
jgi:D-tagatose-1,6-bisphosphate aldolase subunit GatZ/KbaZ